MDIVRKRRTRSYDANMKKKIILYAEEHGNRAAGRAFNIPESCIRLWRKRKMESELSVTQDANKPVTQGVLSEMENTINIPATDTTSDTMTTVTADSQTAEKVVSVSKLEWPEFLDSVLCEYITDLMKAEQPIPIELILLKVQDVAISLNIPQFEFEASRAWVRKFIQQKAHSLHCRISTTHVMSVEFLKRLKAYKNFINKLQRQNNYSLNQIGNANEVPLLLNSLSDKDLTVMLCVTADGRKLPPFIIFKHENVLKKNFPHDTIVRTQKEGHMTPELMLDWYRIVWSCRPGVEHNPRAILTLDASMSHLLTEDWLSDGNTDLVVIPSGSAPIPQPVNLYINNAFKERFRYHCEKWLQSQGKLKSASPSLLTYWISAAWKAVSKETISMSFKKCYLTKTQVGSPSEDEYIVPFSSAEQFAAAIARETSTQNNKLQSKLNISSSSSNINQNEEPISLVLPDEESEIQDPLDMDITSEDVKNTLNDADVKKEIKAELGETDDDME